MRTLLNLRRLAGALVCPISPAVVGIFLAELALWVVTPQRILTQLLVAALGFAAAYLLSLLVPAVRKQLLSLRALADEMHLFKQTA